MPTQTKAAVALIYTAILVASSIYVMLPLQSILTETYHAPLRQIALTSSLFTLSYACGLFLFGALADQIPHRKILLAGMACLTVVTGMLYFVYSIDYLIFFRIVQGFFAASFAPVAFSYTFKHFKESMQGFVIAMINTGFLFAGIFGQIISAFFAKTFSFHAIFFVFFLLYISCFLLLLITLKPTSKKPLRLKSLYITILSCFRDKQLRKLYTIAFFLLFPIMLFYGGFEIYLYNSWPHFPFSLQIFRLLSLVGIVPSFFAGFLVSRFHPASILRCQLAVMTLGFFPAIIFLNAETITIASIAMIASTSLSIPMLVLLVGKFSTDRKSSAVAIYSFTLLIGASIGTTLAPLISFPSILILLPGIFLFLFLFAKRLPSA